MACAYHQCTLGGADYTEPLHLFAYFHEKLAIASSKMKRPEPKEAMHITCTIGY